MALNTTSPEETAIETADAPPPADASSTEHTRETALVLDELLVEDVSIDGMCGVY
ncbi:MAG: mycofactocin precursor MftA [Solirubrobacteraceae bacterium]